MTHYLVEIVYAELINPKVGEDTDRICEKIGHVYKLAM